MRRLLPLLAVPLLAVGCDDVGPTIYQVPNDPPVAVAYIDNGPDNDAQQLLGYYIVGQTARLDATESYDQDNTNKDNLTYTWEFLRLPTDDFGDVTSSLSAADIVLLEDDPETEEINEQSYASFVPDVPGTYRLSLVVQDGADPPGVSDPAIVTVQALPPSELRIELDWEDTRADLDLHLVAPGGDYFVEGDDCFSWFPNPNWGESALATDNPILSGDADGEGVGPYRETIALEVPYEGDFQVYVHYYSDHAAELGLTPVSAEPTLDVTVFGQSILSGVAEPDVPLLAGQVWYAGIIRWPSMEFAHNGQVLDHAADLGGPPYNEEI